MSQTRSAAGLTADDVIATVTAELTGSLSGAYSPGAIRAVVERAAAELRGCTSRESLPEMTARLARVRLETGEAASN